MCCALIRRRAASFCSFNVTINVSRVRRVSKVSRVRVMFKVIRVMVSVKVRCASLLVVGLC